MINDIRKFYEIISLVPSKVYLQQNEYLVNAQSLMGIFSLDLTKVVTLICEQELDDSILDELKEFSVDD
jgi:phosphotransferase system HPr-like phosphotransfer protein